MNISTNNFQVASGKHVVPTKAHTKAEDQLAEVFDLWTRNNVGEQEFNVASTHPEAFETAMTMVQLASKESSGDGDEEEEEETLLFPGSKVQLESGGQGQFAVGLHELSFSGKGIVGKEAVAILFVDSTPGKDGTIYSVGFPPNGKS